MRHIAPEIFTDEVIGKLPPEHQLLWIGMLACLADDQGRIVDAPALIVGELFPYNSLMQDDIVDAGLQWLHARKKIIRYPAGGNGSGRRLIQIRRWWKYQANALWAARSKFPAPDGWTDRIRQHEGHPIIEINWDKVGGLHVDGGHRKRTSVKPVPAKALHRTSTGAKQAQEEDDVNDEDEDNKDKRVPPSLPSSRHEAAQADGRMDAHVRLTNEQRGYAERIQKILHVASFGDKRKAVSLSQIMATRIYIGGPIHHTIASFAGAYASGKARDPVAVAVHQLQEDAVNPTFDDPKLWRSVPPQILKAAGIDDLGTYAAEYALRKFQGA